MDRASEQLGRIYGDEIEALTAFVQTRITVPGKSGGSSTTSRMGSSGQSVGNLLAGTADTRG